MNQSLRNLSFACLVSQAACSPAVLPARRPGSVGQVQGYACNSQLRDVNAVMARAVAQATSRAKTLGTGLATNLRCSVVQTKEACPDCWICAQCSGSATPAKP